MFKRSKSARKSDVRRAKPGKPLLSLEPLEVRAMLSATADSPLASPLQDQDVAAAQPLASVSYPGGVTVTDTQILTETEVIPRFAASPTNTNIRSGSWNDPTIWSAGHVPTDGDRVVIAAKTLVAYSAVNNAHLNALEISGTLNFSAITNTRLIVGTTTVMPTGTLQIGTVSAPISSRVTAELIIADQALNLTQDPSQYGTGLLVLGKINIHGAPLSQSWTRLAAEAKAGDTSVLLSNVVTGWKAGDTVILPDTRQARSSDESAFLAGNLSVQLEEVTIDHIVGNRVYLTAPLAYSHLGARNAAGTLEMLPAVGVETRNVVIRSENPDGTRGHTFYTARADVDIEYAQFADLGRTDAFRSLDSTTYDSSGKVTHIGTNQVGRYAIHVHHLMGPENPTNTGYQFKLIGNVVEDAKKWGVAIHDSSFGLIQDNIVCGAQGAGFVTEDGSEIGNQFLNNFAVMMQGTNQDGKSGTAEGDFARGGSGFWFRRGGNTIVGNVAADTSFAGFMFDGYNAWDPVTIPNFRGADKHEPGQGTVTKLSPQTIFVNNESYGMTSFGLWAAFISGDNMVPGQPLTTILNFKAWNIENSGAYVYHATNVTFDGVLMLFDPVAQNINSGGSTGLLLRTYEDLDIVIRNTRIENARTGIVAPQDDGSAPGVPEPTVIENSTLRNYINIQVIPGATTGNWLIVRNVKFEIRSSIPSGPLPTGWVDPPANIHMKLWGDLPNLTKPSVVQVFDFNQVPGDNFQVFYKQQSNSSILAQTDPSLLSGRNLGIIGSPESGQTNLYNWLKYGIALAGGLVPDNATTRAGINGLVAPLIDYGQIPPRVVFVTPWDNAQIAGDKNTLLAIRYNMVGLLPAGAQIFFSLDNGTPFTSFKDGGIYNVTAGAHVLRAWVGKPDGSVWPQTTVTVSHFIFGAATSAAQLAAVDAGSAVDASGLNAVAPAIALTQTRNAPAEEPTAGLSLTAVQDVTLAAAKQSLATDALWTSVDVGGGGEVASQVEALLDELSGQG